MVVTFKQLGNYGRLGNQLFQISCVVSTAVKYNKEFVLPNWDKSPFFNVPENKFSSSLPLTVDYQEPYFHFKEIPNFNEKNMNLIGYFQSEKYFKHCEDLIRSYLTPKSAIFNFSDTTSIHVRRGDYISLGKCFKILDMKYYEKAIDKTNTKNYMVFSDDIDWCKKHFTDNNFIFVEGNSPEVDLAMMSCCEHNIIANSSFSWWGAWLNKNVNKKIIAPMEWFGPELSPTHNTKDLIPESWIRI